MTHPATKSMPVEVSYGLPDQQWLVTVEVPVGSCVGDVLALPEVRQQLPAEAWETDAMGVFSQPCDGSTVLEAHDRIELYRPLLCDPKEMRRARAQIKRDADEARKKQRKKRLR